MTNDEHFLRRLIRITTKALIAILGLIFIVGMFLSLPIGERFLSNALASVFKNKLDVSISLDIETNIFSRLVLRNLTVDSAVEEDVLLSIQHLRLDYYIWELIPIPGISSGKVRNITIDGFDVRVTRDVDGQLNLPTSILTSEKDTKPPPKKKSSGQFKVERLSFSSSILRYEDEIIDLSSEMRDLEISATYLNDPLYGIRMQSESLFTKVSDFTVPISKMNLLWTIDRDNNIKLEIASMQLFQMDISAEFEMSSDEIAGNISIVGSLSDAFNELRKNSDVELIPQNGFLDVHFDISGSFEDPIVEYAIEFSDVTNQDNTTLAPFVKILGSFEKQLFSVSEFKADIMGLSIEGTAHMDSFRFVKGEVMFESQILDVTQIQSYLVDVNNIESIEGYFVFSTDLENLMDDVAANGKINITNLHTSFTNIPHFEMEFEIADDKIIVYSTLPQVVIEAQSTIKDMDSIDFYLSWDTPHWIFKMLDIEPISIAGSITGNLEFSEQNLIEIKKYEVSAFDGTISGSGQISLDPPNENTLNMIISNIDIAQCLEYLYLDSTPYGGLLYGDITSRGNLQDVRSIMLKSSLELRNAKYYDESISNFTINISKDAESLNADLSLIATEVKISIRFKNNDIEGEFEVAIDDLNLLGQLLNINDLGGFVNINGLIGGSTQQPIINAKVASTDLSYLDFPMNNLFCELRWDTQNVSVDTLMLTGHIDELSTIELLGDYEVSGNLHYSLRLSGDIPNVKGKLHIASDYLGANDLEFDKIIFGISLEDQVIALDYGQIIVNEVIAELKGKFAMAEKKGQLDVLFSEYVDDGDTNSIGLISLNADLEGEEQSRFYLNSINTDLSAIRHFYQESPFIRGLLSTDLSIVMERDVVIPRVNGFLSITDTELMFDEDVPSVIVHSAEFGFKDYLVDIVGMSASFSEHSVNVVGNVEAGNLDAIFGYLDFRFDNDSYFRVQGGIEDRMMDVKADMNEFDLKVMSPYIAGFADLNGVFNAHMSIIGDVSSPRFDGYASIDGLGFALSDIPIRTSDGKMNISFRNEAIHLDTLSIKVNEGLFSAAGVLSQGSLFHGNDKELDGVNLRLTASNIHLDDPQLYSLKLSSADIRIGHSAGESTVSGNIRMGDSRLKARLQPQMLVDMIRKGGRESQQPSKFMKQLKLDIRLIDSDQLWVDNNLARVKMHAELNVTGSAAQVNLNGRLQVVEGYIYYLDRRFDITRGMVYFSDPHRINPNVDVEARSVIRNYQSADGIPYVITISLIGPSDDVIISIISDPPLEMADIVSVLTLGVTRDRLWGGDGSEEGTSVGNVLMDRLDEYSSRRIYGYVSRQVGGMLGLDRMDIEGSLFNIDSGVGPQLTAAKRLTDRLEVTYTTVVGRSEQNKMLVNYLLTEQWSLQGETDQSGRSGVDLKYRFRF